jgi:acyl-CoA thioester hydrolase
VTSFVVRTYELDGFRHVNNAVFVQYLEAARGDFVRAVGLGYAKFHEWAACPVVVRVEVDYATPAAADELLTIELRISAWRRTQVEFAYEVRRADGATVARAMTRHAFVNPDGAPVRVPDEFRRAVEAWAIPEG